jgi:hypothetical protein
MAPGGPASRGVATRERDKSQESLDLREWGSWAAKPADLLPEMGEKWLRKALSG